MINHTLTQKNARIFRDLIRNINQYGSAEESDVEYAIGKIFHISLCLGAYQKGMIINMKFSQQFIKANDAVCDFDNYVNAPYIRKKFNVPFESKRAEITICGLGFYELYINGKNITKSPLAPYISNTDDVCYYDNYDITDLLVRGDNAVGIILGNGFRNCFGGDVWNMEQAHCRGPVTAALCIEVDGNGKTISFEADETFKTHPSPIIFDDLRMGCRYDARLEIKGWCDVDFDDSSWAYVKKEKTPRGEARLCNADPIAVSEVILPIDVKRYESLPFAYENNSSNAKPIEGCARNNVYVFDFGVNAAGVTKLKINGNKGQKIVIRHGEYMHGSDFSVNSVGFFDEWRPAKTISHYTDYNQVDVYICKGGEEEFIPKFKYDGFRYAYVEGLEESQIKDDTLTYLVMNANVKSRAEFECSDNVLNKLQECTRRSDLANFYYFPTDCPHREKNGWTGDAAVSAEHMLLNLKVEKSLREWLFNIRKAQREDGVLPGIVPTGGWGVEWGNGPAWDNVCVSLPYYIYKYTGDTEVIKENLSLIMRYLCYISSMRDEHGLIAVGLGDWLDPFEKENGHIAAPLELTDSITVYDMAKKSAYLFKKIGRENESEYAERLSTELRNDIRKHLIDERTMTAAGNCQTSQAFALDTGIFNEDEIRTAQDRLIEIVHRDGDINACGMIGLRHIFHALTDAGKSELAYKIITGKSRTCYGYWIENGATSLWEDFKDKDDPFPDSKNHHFLGDISSWFIQEIAGLKPNPNVNDIHFFEISPHFINAIDYAKASYDSIFGKVNTMWQREKNEIQLDISMPKGTYGRITLPKGYCFENGDTSMDLKHKDEVICSSLKVKYCDL